MIDTNKINYIDQALIDEERERIFSFLETKSLITEEVSNLLNQEYDNMEDFVIAITGNEVIEISGALDQYS